MTTRFRAGLQRRRATSFLALVLLAVFSALPALGQTLREGLPVVITVTSADFDAARVQSAIEGELGVRLAAAADSVQRLEVIVIGRRAHVSYFAPEREPVTRSVDLPKHPERALETLAFLAGNLARDEAEALLNELRPAGEPGESAPDAPPPPPQPAPAVPDATPKELSRKPAVARPGAPAPALIEPEPFAANASLFHPLALLPNTERRRMNLEFGVAYSRLGALRGAALTFGYLRTDGPTEGFGYAVGWNRAGPVDGVQLAHIVAEGYGRLRGFAHGDFANVREGDVEGALTSTLFAKAWNVRGAQLGGIVAMARDVTGAQLAAAAAYADGSVTGASLGLVSSAREALNGLQVGAAAAYAGRVNGVALAGIAGITQRARGLQLSGGVNVAREVAGAQLSLVNIGGRVEGVQLGLVNIAREIDGGALGLVSIAGNGQIQGLAWVAGGVETSLNAGLKFTTDLTYSYVGVGRSPFADHDRLEAGAGLHLGSVTNGFIEAGAGYAQLRETDGLDREPVRQDLRYDARVGWNIGGVVAPYLGGGVDMRLAGGGRDVRGNWFAGLALF